VSPFGEVGPKAPPPPRRGSPEGEALGVAAAAETVEESLAVGSQWSRLRLRLLGRELDARQIRDQVADLLVVMDATGETPPPGIRRVLGARR